MKIQLALDLLDINKILEIINETIEYIDVIELGTPLIMKYGINIVNDIKNIHRNKYILADLKIADGGKKEAEIGFKAGADIITVLSHSDKNTLLYVKEASKNFNKKVMLDFLNNDFNKNNYLNLLKYEFDFYCIHTSHDSTYDGHNPLNDLKRLMEEKKVMYNHKTDKRKANWGNGEKLEKIKLEEIPNYIRENIEKYKLWLDI